MPTKEELDAAVERSEDLILNGPRTQTLHGTPIGPHEEIDPKTGMQKDYIVLSDHERARLPNARPLRKSYKHLTCGTVTTMGLKLSETYQKNPSFYSGTYCCGCQGHFPVGENGEFVWMDGNRETTIKVGT